MEFTPFNTACECEFCGTAYAGWQRQNNGSVSIQNVLEEKLSGIYGEEIKIVGSGRTDAGVHALGLVFNFASTRYRAPNTLVRWLNFLLPDDIKIMGACSVTSHFHARHAARSKTYLYRIINRATPPALENMRAMWVRRPIDIEKLQQILEKFVGEHDFSAFSVTSTRQKNTIRRVNFIKVKKFDWDAGLDRNSVEIEINANAFLHNMVRVIIGTAVKALNDARYSDIERILESRDRRNAAETAPAYGLYQKAVYYNDNGIAGIRGIPEKFLVNYNEEC